VARRFERLPKKLNGVPVARTGGSAFATACPLRARSALCRELLKIVVWDIEDTASEMTPMQWHDYPTVFQEKILNGVECHAREGLFVPLHARFGHAVLFSSVGIWEGVASAARMNWGHSSLQWFGSGFALLVFGLTWTCQRCMEINHRWRDAPATWLWDGQDALQAFTCRGESDLAYTDPSVIGGDLLIDQDSQVCFAFQSLEDCIQQQFILEHAA